jgi:hypothetical protein
MFPAGSVRMKMLSIIHRSTGCPPWASFSAPAQFHQFLGGRGHILIALSERHDREAHALKVLHHLHSAPTVKGDFTDVVLLTQLLDELLDESRNGLHCPPWSAGIPAAPKRHRAHGRGGHAGRVVFRYPEIRQNDVFIILICGREHQHECRNIRGGGKVESAVADAPFQVGSGFTAKAHLSHLSIGIQRTACLTH